MTTFESSHYLLCALGDGALFYFGLNIETGEAGSWGEELSEGGGGAEWYGTAQRGARALTVFELSVQLFVISSFRLPPMLVLL